ncbi:hypothetical protein BAOM_4283 [Peribacillus asahii]|uniref:Uncharacterized protein n=1 Tax=Peribacillus asahii TaxID=228899 RepID=A0A3T0KX39_9BACI|nr:hypothetical protein BAOM_4283 [Peribacillus asahii]
MVLLSFCSPNSLDFKGRPIKNLFIDENIYYSSPIVFIHYMLLISTIISQKVPYSQKKSAYKSSLNRPVDTSFFLRHKLHLPSHITLTRLAVGFGPLSSPTLKKDSPLGLSINPQKWFPRT